MRAVHLSCGFVVGLMISVVWGMGAGVVVYLVRIWSEVVKWCLVYWDSVVLCVGSVVSARFIHVHMGLVTGFQVYSGECCGGFVGTLTFVCMCWMYCNSGSG